MAKVAPSEQPQLTKENSQPQLPKTKSFVKKYFMEGQALHEGAPREVPPDADFLLKTWIKYRKYLGVLLPETVMLTLWLFTAIRYDWFSLFATHWQMPVVMILGATVAGLTAESGGAVAFPIMTLVMHIKPEDARDFSLIIEANAMLCAMIAVFIMGVQTEHRAILFGTIGSIPGLIVGFEFCDQLLTGPQKKMLFVSIWCSFAVALFLLNQEKKRKTFMEIPDFKPWKALVLVATGFVGGVLTSFVGSGVDICLFSIITVLFRVSEKSATPTTIILMGMNALIGAYFRAVWVGNVHEETWSFIKTSIPVTLIVAPTMSLIGSHFHRQVLAFFVYILELLAVVGFVITGPPVMLLVIGAVIIIIGFGFFYWLGKVGAKLMMDLDANKDGQKPPTTVSEA